MNERIASLHHDIVEAAKAWRTVVFVDRFSGSACNSAVQRLERLVAQLQTEEDLARAADEPKGEHWCCGAYLGYGTSCPTCKLQCGCKACRDERKEERASNCVHVGCRIEGPHEHTWGGPCEPERR